MNMSHEALPLSSSDLPSWKEGCRGSVPPPATMSWGRSEASQLCAKHWAHVFLIHMGHSKQRILTFLVPDTNFVEDKFSTDREGMV